MKQIKIQQFTSPDKQSIYTERQKYKVTLGNGYIGTFTDKKNLSNFITEANLFLNTKLHELNFIYIELFGFYRIAWFYMDQKKSSQLNLRQLETKTQNSLRQMDQAFNLIIDRSGYTNGNHFVFSHFKSIINPQIDLIENLLLLYKSKGHTDKVYKLEFLKNQLLFIDNEIKVYPETETNLIEKLKEML